ncbi:MAG TPA: glycosyltransferase [Solirubrobacteraceae bacterium]|nr:glycosyltransferase [Solirubrobacteraceae bacterium]
MAPRVSVIIPARNAGASLGETLDSVIAQTYEDWEAIVADDASSDATGELAAGYHPKVRCVRSPRNLGIGGARNLALACASGELVALLDADDLWLPGYLETQLARYDQALARGENVGIVCCDAYLFDSHGPRDGTASQRIGWADPVTLTTLLHKNTICVSAIVPRALIEQLGGFATDCLGTEDYDMWLRILETGASVLASREPLFRYRIADTAVSANVAVMAKATQTTYRHALERGRLSAGQRAIARREMRMQRFVELWEEVALRRGQTGIVPWGLVGEAAPLGARVVLERPTRWAHWLKIGLAIAAGAPAAGVDRSGVR